VYMNSIKLIIQIALSAIVSYIFFFYVTSPFFYFFYNGNSPFDFPIILILYIGQTLIIYIISNLLINRRINSKNLNFMWCIYFLVMAFLLFGRQQIGSRINMNIMEMFNLNQLNILQNLMNFLLFIPIGYLLRKLKLAYSVIVGLLNVLAVETTQLILQRGIFDIVDIVIDTLSILTGYLITKRIIRNKQMIKY